MFETRTKNYKLCGKVISIRRCPALVSNGGTHVIALVSEGSGQMNIPCTWIEFGDWNHRDVNEGDIVTMMGTLVIEGYEEDGFIVKLTGAELVSNSTHECKHPFVSSEPKKVQEGER